MDNQPEVEELPSKPQGVPRKSHAPSSRPETVVQRIPSRESQHERNGLHPRRLRPHEGLQEGNMQLHLYYPFQLDALVQQRQRVLAIAEVLACSQLGTLATMAVAPTRTGPCFQQPLQLLRIPEFSIRIFAITLSTTMK